MVGLYIALIVRPCFVSWHTFRTGKCFCFSPTLCCVRPHPVAAASAPCRAPVCLCPCPWPYPGLPAMWLLSRPWTGRWPSISSPDGSLSRAAQACLSYVSKLPGVRINTAKVAAAGVSDGGFMASPIASRYTVYTHSINMHNTWVSHCSGSSFSKRQTHLQAATPSLFGSNCCG